MFEIITVLISVLSAALFLIHNHINSLTFLLLNFAGLFSVNLLFFNLLSALFCFREGLFRIYFIILCFIISFLFCLQIKNGYILTPEIMYATLHPERDEIRNFLSIADILLILIPTAICYFVYKKIHLINFKITKKFFIKILAILFANAALALLASATNTQKKNHSQLIVFVKDAIFTTPINFFYSITMVATQDDNAINSAKINLTATNLSGDNNIKIYYLIGESARFDKFAINGYSKNTTPNLLRHQKNGNLINFSSVNYSCDITTFLSVPCMLSGSQNGTKYDLLKIFKTAKYKTIVRSPNANHIFKVIRTSLFQNSQFVTNNYTTDSDISKYITEDVKKNKGKKMFSVIQMIGSHNIYNIEKHITNKQNILQPYCKHHSLRDCALMSTNQHLFNSYDNTIVHTDEILDEIFNVLKNENAIVFFAPDHAELLGEDGYFGHGVTMPNGTKIKQQYQIPVFVWMSDRYKKLHPHQYNKFVKKSKKSTDHLQIYQSIIHCNNIEVEGLNTEGSLCR